MSLTEPSFSSASAGLSCIWKVGQGDIKRHKVVKLTDQRDGF